MFCIPYLYIYIYILQLYWLNFNLKSLHYGTVIKQNFCSTIPSFDFRDVGPPLMKILKEEIKFEKVGLCL